MRLIDPKLQEKLAKRARQLLIQEIVKRKGKTRIVEQIKWKLQGEAQIILEAPQYLEFIDKGVNGTQDGYGSPYSYKKKKPPVQAIAKWASLKGVNRDPWAIATNIFKFGIKPTHVIQNAMEAFDKELPKEIEVELSRSIEDHLLLTLNKKSQ